MTDSIFDELFKKAYAYSIQRLAQLTGSSSIAKELFVKAITKYWMKQKQGELKDIEYVEKYIYTIAKNDWFDQQKKKRTEMVSNPAEIDRYKREKTDVFDATEFDDLIKQENIEELEKEKRKRNSCLKRAFKRLSPSCQKMLTSAVTYNKSNKELQKELNYESIDVVKSTKCRCKNYLKKLYLQELKKIKGING